MDMVEQPMIAAILGDSMTSEEACQRLVVAALDSGGKDKCDGGAGALSARCR